MVFSPTFSQRRFAGFWSMVLLTALLPGGRAVAQTQFSAAAPNAVQAAAQLPNALRAPAPTGGTGRGNFSAVASGPVLVGRSPYGLAAGDIDGDGDLDFVTANDDFGRGHTVSICRNDGKGTFSTGPRVRVGAGPRCVALGDVDGDGDLDLLTANRAANTVSVRLNDGAGRFRAPARHAEPGVLFQPQSLALGDVDGDGDLDFVAGNGAGTHAVSVRLNDGTGHFTAPARDSEPLVGSIPLSVALADVDHDGDLDLLSANFGSGTVSVRLNDGRGRFSGGVEADTPVGAEPLSLAVGDVDGDGDLDLLTANSAATSAAGSPGTYSVSVRLNDGAGRFGAAATHPDMPLENRPAGLTVGDVDGDGDLDLLTANYGVGSGNTLSVRLNDGAGRFAASISNPNPVVGSGPVGVMLGDVDGDGDLDFLATSSGANSVSVGLNEAAPGAAPAVVRQEP